MKSFLTHLSLTLMFFIFFRPLRAQTQDQLTQFCFPPNIDLARVQSSLAPLLLKGEQVYPRPSLHCVEIPLSSARANLFETYLRQRFPLVGNTSSSPSSSSSSPSLPSPPLKENCALIFVQRTQGEAKKNDAEWDPWGKKIKLQQENQNVNSEDQSFLLLQSGSSGRLQVDGTGVDVICQHLSPERYQIELSLSQFKADQSSQQLSTTVSLSKGENLNIGEIVQNLKGKNQDLSLGRGVQWEKEQGQRTIQYFLRIR